MEDNKKEEVILYYKLVGVLNLLDVVPEIVYPVFENKLDNSKKLFVQHKGDPIESFDFLLNKELITHVKPLESFNLVSPKITKEFKVGDESIIGYQYDDKNLFIGTIPELIQHAEETNDETMKERINVVLEFYNLKNSEQKL